jgi:hypothetical protein
VNEGLAKFPLSQVVAGQTTEKYAFVADDLGYSVMVEPLACAVTDAEPSALMTEARLAAMVWKVSP